MLSSAVRLGGVGEEGRGEERSVASISAVTVKVWDALLLRRSLCEEVTSVSRCPRPYWWRRNSNEPQHRREPLEMMAMRSPGEGGGEGGVEGRGREGGGREGGEGEGRGREGGEGKGGGRGEGGEGEGRGREGGEEWRYPERYFCGF